MLKKLFRPLRRLQALLRLWRASYILKRNRYESWAVYRHFRDPNVNYNSMSIDGYYHGYKRIHTFPESDSFVYTHVRDYKPGKSKNNADIRDWCEKNLKSKWRLDRHLIIHEYSLLRIDRSYQHIKLTDTNYEHLLKFGDYSVIFFVCQDDEDFSHFMLRWG